LIFIPAAGYIIPMTDTVQSLGQFFIISFPEERPSDRTLHFITDNNIGGIIVFAHHCRDIDNLKSWLRELKDSRGPDFLIAVDQEGGRVQRLRNRFPGLEAPRYYGYHNLEKQYRSDLFRTCEQLRELGINYNLVPGVDLFDSDENHVLDSRTFGDDIGLVARFARLTIAIHHEQGLLTAAKHFPGLGRSEGDPHNVLAEADLSEEEFFEHEIKPFRMAIDEGVDSVMVSHLMMPQIDEKPSIISEKVISGWLKTGLAFSGPAVTDDLLMQGAWQALSFPAVVEKSFMAGSDLLLFGADLKKAREAFEFFTERAAHGAVSSERLSDARQRIAKLRRKLTDWYG